MPLLACFILVIESLKSLTSSYIHECYLAELNTGSKHYLFLHALIEDSDGKNFSGAPKQLVCAKSFMCIATTTFSCHDNKIACIRLTWLQKMAYHSSLELLLILAMKKQWHRPQREKERIAIAILYLSTSVKAYRFYTMSTDIVLSEKKWPFIDIGRR